MKKLLATVLTAVSLISGCIMSALPASAATKTVQSGGYDIELTPVIIVLGAGLFLIVAAVVVGIIIIANKGSDDDEEDEEEEEAEVDDSGLEE